MDEAEAFMERRVKVKRKDAAAVALGRKGGKAATKEQQKARSLNLRNARKKRWVDITERSV